MAVRNESVRLSLQDDFTSGMARATAATALFKRSLDDLDGTNVKTNRSLSDTAVQTDRLGASMNSNAKEIDKFSGRLRLFADLAAILGPGLVPIGAVAVPAVTALASQLGFAVLGAGSLVVAFQGVGDTIKAVNDAALEPTAENLDKAREAMSKLGPEAQEFVTRFQEIRPVLSGIRDSAAAGWFPGLTESLDSLIEVGPRVGEILRVIGEAGGNLVAEGAQALAGDEWSEFLSFVRNNAPQALEELGRSVGNVARGLAELWMAFDPLNDDISGWLLDASRNFAEWADGLSETQGFQDFIAYLRESGPQVADALGSIGNAVLQILEAAAPLGGPVLASITAVADALALIADSAAGPAILAAASAMALLSRASAGWAAVTKTAWATNISGARGLETQARTLGRTMGAAAVGIAAFAAAQSGVAEKAGLSNTALGAMAGSLGGPYGAALGAGIGLTLDLHQANDDLADSIDRVNAAATGSDYAEMIASSKELLESRKSLTSQGSSILGDPLGFAGATLSGDWNKVVDDFVLGGKEATDALDAVDKAADNFTVDHIGQAIGILGGEMQAATDEINEFAESFRGLQDLLDNRASLRDYEESVDHLNKSIKENGNHWDAAGAKGRANLEALDTLVGTAIERSDQLFKTGKKTASQGMLTRALDDLRDFRRENPRAAESVQPLIDKLKRVHDQRVKPKIEIDDGQFMTGLSRMGAGLRKLDNSKASPMVTVAGNALGTLGAIAGSLAKIDGTVAQATINVIRTGATLGTGVGADGTTVPKTGKPYADRHLYMLADGEEVISNRHGQADRHRDLLKRINAGRLAEGGTSGFASQTYNQTPRNTGTLHATEYAGNALMTLSQWALDDARIRRQILRGELRDAEKLQESRKKDLDASKQWRDGVISAMQGLAGNLTGKVDTGIFGAGATFESAISSAAKIGSSSSALIEAIKRLRARGFSERALNRLLEEGDIDTIIRFSQYSSSQLQQLGSAVVGAGFAANQAGQFGGAQVFGSQLSAANAAVSADTAELREANKMARNAEKRAEKFEKKFDKLHDEVKAIREAAETNARDTGRTVGEQLRSQQAAAGRNRR